MMASYSFKKQERLCDFHKINLLFSRKGKAIHSSNLSLFYLSNISETNLYSIQSLFSIPKKRIKKATSRVLLRRRLKEAYRMNKSLFYNNDLKNNKEYSIVVMYRSNKIMKFSEIEEELVTLINRFCEKIK